MSDNVGYTPGVGATVAADDIGGVLHQRIKLGVGGDGVAVDVSETNPLPIIDTNQSENYMLGVRILNALDSPRGYDKSIQRHRSTVILESGTVSTVSTVSTVTTVTTVTTVSNIASLGTDQAQLLTRGSNMSAWANVVRSRIT